MNQSVKIIKAHLRILMLFSLLFWVLLGPNTFYAFGSESFSSSYAPVKPRDRDPLFPGGEIGLKNFIDSTLQYPTSLMAEKLTGVVYALVLIEETGFISFKHLLDPVHPLFAAEALRVLEVMPRWKPALRNWKPFPALQIIPLVFAPAGTIKPTIRKIYLLPQLDDSPEFQGGEPALMCHIVRNQIYPYDSRIKDCDGEVRLTLIVNGDGQVEMVQLLSGIGEPCDSRAIQIVKEMPNWKPGRLNGENVNVMINLPIGFSKIDTTKIAGDDVFTVVEEMPEFPGGDQAKQQYLQDNIRYPIAARSSGIQGTVYITFVVEPDGSLSNFRVLRGIGGGCDEEAVRVIKEMPKWKPGRQRGEAKRVQFNMPIRFTLRN